MHFDQHVKIILASFFWQSFMGDKISAKFLRTFWAQSYWIGPQLPQTGPKVGLGHARGCRLLLPPPPHRDEVRGGAGQIRPPRGVGNVHWKTLSSLRGHTERSVLEQICAWNLSTDLGFRCLGMRRVKSHDSSLLTLWGNFWKESQSQESSTDDSSH